MAKRKHPNSSRRKREYWTDQTVTLAGTTVRENSRYNFTPKYDTCKAAMRIAKAPRNQ